MQLKQFITILINDKTSTKKKIKFCKKGAKGLGVDVVAPVLLGKDNWKNLSQEKKDAYTRQYNANWKQFDQFFQDKRSEEYSKAIQHPDSSTFVREDKERPTTYSTRQFEDAASQLIGSTPARGSDLISEGIFFYTDDNRSYDQYDENQMLERVLQQAPQIKLNTLENNNKLGNRNYLQYVKHTDNDRYYDSLIQKANKKYGTNFKSRADVAAFQLSMGAIAVDGIIGPETEGLLQFYYPSTTSKLISNKKFYRNESNDAVLNRTRNILAYNSQDEPNNSQLLNLDGNYSGYSFFPFAINYSSSYISPYSKYLRNAFSPNKQ